MRILFVSNSYLDIRAGRLAAALTNRGHKVDGLCFRWPPQFAHVYDHLTCDPYMDMRDLSRLIAESDADIIHVHGELYGFFPALAAREGSRGRPVVLDVHDLACARPNSMLDPHEASGFFSADAYVWVTEEQRAYGEQMGLVSDKPYVYLTNYISSSCFIDKPCLPHIGGVCISGGISRRGDDTSERDHSAIADALGGDLHIYPGAEPPDYGILHPQEPRYPLYLQRLAAHDWGFVGTDKPKTSWLQALPTRVTEYMAAGIPGIYMNIPAAIPFAEAGMGVYIESLADLKRVMRQDPKPFRKAIRANRRQFTVEAIIDPLLEMYSSLRGD